MGKYGAGVAGPTFGHGTPDSFEHFGGAQTFLTRLRIVPALARSRFQPHDARNVRRVITSPILAHASLPTSSKLLVITPYVLRVPNFPKIRQKVVDL